MRDLNHIRIPETDPIPRWYRLGTKGTGTLVIHIHEKAVDHLCSAVSIKAPLVQGIMKKFRFDFIPPTSPVWGFGRETLFGPEAPLCATHSEHDNWKSWECTLPIFKNDNDHHKFMAVRATLALLFEFLQLFGIDGNTGEKKFQLVIIQGMRLDYDLHGGSLGAVLTPAMMPYLHRQPNESSLVEVVKAMRQASHYILGKPETYSDTYDYRALCRQPKWINLKVMGDACGLDPNEYYEKSLSKGYHLAPHNIDTSFQQLCFLMGLAKLHQLAERNS